MEPNNHKFVACVGVAVLTPRGKSFNSLTTQIPDRGANVGYTTNLAVFLLTIKNLRLEFYHQRAHALDGLQYLHRGTEQLTITPTVANIYPRAPGAPLRAEVGVVGAESRQQPTFKASSKRLSLKKQYARSKCAPLSAEDSSRNAIAASKAESLTRATSLHRNASASC